MRCGRLTDEGADEGVDEGAKQPTRPDEDALISDSEEAISDSDEALIPDSDDNRSDLEPDSGRALQQNFEAGSSLHAYNMTDLIASRLDRARRQSEPGRGAIGSASPSLQLRDLDV